MFWSRVAIGLPACRTPRGGRRSATIALMSSFLRILVLLSVLALTALLVYRPQRWRNFLRRVRIVGYAYVAAIVISALLRITGVWDWGT